MQQSSIHNDQFLGVGERLRQARESRHISIRGASRRLRIHEKYLRALEEEDFSALPQGAYILGFMRNYANFLGLDFNEIKHIYQKEVKQEQPAEEISPSLRKKNGSGFVLTPGKMVAFTIFLGGLLLVWYLFSQYQELTRAPKLEVYSPISGQVYTEKNITISGWTDPNAVLTIDGEEISLSSTGEFSRQFVAFKNGYETLMIVAENRISKKKTIVQRSFEVDLPSSDVLSLDEDGELISEGTDIEQQGLVLSVRVIDRVWLSVSIDNAEEQEFILEKDQEITFKADDQIYLHSGRPYATYVSINGEDEELMSDSNVTQKIWKASD